MKSAELIVLQALQRAHKNYRSAPTAFAAARRSKVGSVVGTVPNCMGRSRFHADGRALPVDSTAVDHAPGSSFVGSW